MLYDGYLSACTLHTIDCYDITILTADYELYIHIVVVTLLHVGLNHNYFVDIVLCKYDSMTASSLNVRIIEYLLISHAIQ